MRYMVITDSMSGHCCFDFTVVDRQRAHPVYKDQFHWVCECFSEADADMICKALNEQERLRALGASGAV